MFGWRRSAPCGAAGLCCGRCSLRTGLPVVRSPGFPACLRPINQGGERATVRAVCRRRVAGQLALHCCGRLPFRTGLPFVRSPGFPACLLPINQGGGRPRLGPFAVVVSQACGCCSGARRLVCLPFVGPRARRSWAGLPLVGSPVCRTHKLSRQKLGARSPGKAERCH